MWIMRALPALSAGTVLAGTVLAGAAPVAAAPVGVDVVPVLTSTPFGAPPGQAVTHTITLSSTGPGTVAAVRVTFATTVELDSVTATATAGTCPVVTALTVVCDLGEVAFSDANPAPKVTVAGIVHAGGAPGAVVQNLANVTLGAVDADPGNNVVSNAYLVTGASTAPIGGPPGGPVPDARPTASGRASGMSQVGTAELVIVAVLALAGGAAALLVVRRRRRRT
ncbi:hypothetical protein ACNTMW_32975 [Planosporangium sp. 12N6]|uniref:hypothetical protein n=1 Tax=Planosporangium spinosum TaxID=3402278 RepID=UPI003CF6A2CC